MLRGISDASKIVLSLFLVAVLLPLCASAGVVSLNGNCIVGNCASPDSLSLDNTVSGTFDTQYTFGDGDTYRVQGNWSWVWVTESAGMETFMVRATDAAFTMEYLGSSPSVGSDTLNLSLSQAFDTSVPFPQWFPGYSSVYVRSTELPAGSGLSFSPTNAGIGGQVRLIYHQLVGGFYGNFPGSGQFQNPDVWDYSVTFGEGTQPGSEVFVSDYGRTAVIPEPATLPLLCLGCLGAIAFARLARG